MIIIYALLPALLKIAKRKDLGRILLVWSLLLLIIFFLNVMYKFEKTYVIQTFRLWNHLFYFLLGAYIAKNINTFKWIRWWHIIITMSAFFISGKYLNAGGNEYHFCSPLCILYAMTTFCACLNLKIKETKIISMLSQCFLPMYALHMLFLSKIFDWGLMIYVESAVSFAPLAFSIEYLFVSVIMTLICLAIMRIPCMDIIFKI